MVGKHNGLWDAGKTFFSYGFDKESSNVLYSSYKHPLPIFFKVLILKNTQKC